MIDLIAGYVMFGAGCFTFGYYSAAAGGFLNLFDVSDKFKRCCLKLNHWIIDNVFDLKEGK
ncbi:hypothetical protein M5C72_07210 [Companilactobacillus allii]|uniref:Uncharacterized protein n=1 Tax=Companilactobacillus allii TaxID=1847728 RepID=A0A1P8Q4U7_9LACO|nr:hypothetical protein [Companilactobacillus allii]APX72886.1 hypothetical protein BTM29_10125 [Companilactobacillus allii]USQ67674.1 hypothetical protein M5C72_07210 [Companilactobacillus allii]